MIDDMSFTRWFDEYALRFRGAPHERVAPISYGKLSYWLRKAGTALGYFQLQAGRWSSHGLRRGAASHLYASNVDFSTIMMRGRWLSERSAREYVRRGDVALTRAKAQLSSDVQQRALGLASMGAGAFKVLDVGM